MEEPKIGTVGWMDLTVPEADSVREFYSAVVGWSHDSFDMGGYSDYVMKSAEGTPVSGVCHKRGTNEGLPSVWLIYITVADLDASLEACRAGGGKVLSGPKSAGEHGRFAVIQDPAGACCALHQSA